MSSTKYNFLETEKKWQKYWLDGGYGPDNTAKSNSSELPGDDGDYGGSF